MVLRGVDRRVRGGVDDAVEELRIADARDFLRIRNVERIPIHGGEGNPAQGCRLADRRSQLSRCAGDENHAPSFVMKKTGARR